MELVESSVSLGSWLDLSAINSQFWYYFRDIQDNVASFRSRLYEMCYNMLVHTGIF